ncbi:hypothetical protein KL86PLE_10273 [uncultured Pleomorphomonas sp.]|uniref:Uncharacterized protein n=1 Tax=uncultured Pleomorphomonas sp. TaxID=442121 RepID=A0A212KZL8_9HYPH|nr:hypothetical protein KL86PLE_10273 [uncultured Pleomorphomonas sp.]
MNRLTAVRIDLPGQAQKTRFAVRGKEGPAELREAAPQAGPFRRAAAAETSGCDFGRDPTGKISRPAAI